MSDIARITPNEVKGMIESGFALLVCAYDSQEKFEKNRLEGAISLDALRTKMTSLPKDQELVFYCA